MKANDLKAKHFTPDTTSYKVVIEFYTEPNKKGKMSRYALKEFKKGKVVISEVYDIEIKRYVNLSNAIKAGQKLTQYFNNCEVSIIGIDYKGITTDWVKLENLK
jgi:cellulose biosynthesis protein BcsQ